VTDAARPPRGEPRSSRAPRAPRALALAGIAASALALLGAYASAFLPQGPPSWAPWLCMAGASTMQVAFMALGATRPGGLGRLRIPLALVLLLLLGGFSAVLALPATDPSDPTLWLGLPPRAALVFYGVGLLPFLVLPAAYAWTFEDQALAPGEVERLRLEAARAREGHALPDGPAAP
jgi:hypothetical protein